ncbi:hypothetical protein [Mesobacillus jeotgali]|uniref:Uncharacterized protein n=1 Tax=Mesobacillus jeotgali TaxID=129985 RepID=A0ABY9VHG6_9BACI|nr:hypothetical protein [Mesobacillus jeotgali]WNF23394.1 hypothetical protein RH061_02470 [Mesobacillus jeotgali]
MFVMPENLLIEGIHYEKNYNQKIEIPVGWEGSIGWKVLPNASFLIS